MPFQTNRAIAIPNPKKLQKFLVMAAHCDGDSDDNNEMMIGAKWLQWTKVRDDEC